ncbi:hypothetical protein ACNPQM_31525 [Streptomyces sp. NPDC056231]|uniref:hypothetical protein n=1 Tax=Streptomyces sp. NPDC056231 TaxID=3345755 RepID=UPI003AABF5E5
MASRLDETARHHKLTGHLREAGLGALTDLGFGRALERVPSLNTPHFGPLSGT